MIEKGAFVDPSAEVAETAYIANNAFIGKNCVIGENVKVGFGAVVEKNTTVGEGTELSPNSHVGGPPQDVGYKDEETKLTIGKNCIIREFATINRGTTKQDWETIVGDNVFMMSYSHIGHDCVVGDDVVLTNYVALAGHCVVGNKVIFAGMSGAHQFTRVGDMCMVGHHAAVIKDLPPYVMYAGTPAAVTGLNVIGLRRNGVTSEGRTELKRALKIYTDVNKRLEVVIKEIENLEMFDEVRNFLNFIKGDSKRSLTRR